MAKTQTHDLDDIHEMILGSVGDADDAALVAVASILLGPLTLVSAPEEPDPRYTVTSATFQPLPIEKLFSAFQGFLNDSRRAVPNIAKMDEARETFKSAIGPLANLIDWTDNAE